jgi:ADP-dependent NAD(P)H-hydrate dehydratase
MSGKKIMKLIKKIPKLKPRAKDAHKGIFGKVCIIGGSLGMSGAVALAGRAALRSGSGLVRVATPKSVQLIVASIEPCFTTYPLEENDSGRIDAKAIYAILNLVADNDCLAFGPGIGISQGARSIIQKLLEHEGLRLVVDADGLNNLNMINDWPALTKANLILTPHPGEMKRLWTSLFRDPIPADRRDIAVQMANKTKAIIVLKGAGTVVTDGENVYINTTGNPGMATGGTGDVLTGIITSLAGQGFNNFDAAVLGVYVHGLAGDIMAKKLGQVSLIATDVIEGLPEAFKKIVK